MKKISAFCLAVAIFTAGNAYAQQKRLPNNKFVLNPIMTMSMDLSKSIDDLLASKARDGRTFTLDVDGTIHGIKFRQIYFPKSISRFSVNIVVVRSLTTDYSIPEITEEMADIGLRPATVQELVTFALEYPQLLTELENVASTREQEDMPDEYPMVVSDANSGKLWAITAIFAKETTNRYYLFIREKGDEK